MSCDRSSGEIEPLLSPTAVTSDDGNGDYDGQSLAAIGSECRLATNVTTDTVVAAAGPTTTITLGPGENWSKTRHALKVVAVVYSFFYTGVLLTAIGALLEHVMVHHHITHRTASLIFPTRILGYVCAASSLSTVVDRSGWKGVALISPLFHVVSALLLGKGWSSFPAVLVGYFIDGVGTGLSDAGFNAWASRLASANIVQGFNHGAFALGCVLGPIGTLFVTGRDLPWYVFYRGMIVLALLEALLLAIAFRRESGKGFDDAKSLQMSSATSANQPNHSKGPAIKLAICCSLYYFVYEGVENCISDWIVLFMKQVRGIDQTRAALSLSFFWTGIALGRAMLGPVTAKFGIRVAVPCYTLGSVCSQTLFLLTRSNVGSFALLTLTGVLMGPMFPSAMVLMAQRLPLKEVVAAVAVAVSIGQIGGAVSAAIVGVMIDEIGLQSSFNATLGLLMLLLVIWLIFSRIC